MTIGLFQDGFGYIEPIGIIPLDEADLLLAPPLLYFFFSRDCRCHIVVRFEANQARNVIFRCKAPHHPARVLVNAPDQIVRYANVERPVLSAGEEVDVMWHAGELIPGDPNALAAVRSGR